ncbi:LINE-1 reverse transcriptase-like [Symbiodinium microadriaticum]|uniref:LINE-1 reverse transcriptase-like n=1 Tax=Symbiodinium microadriaticum TaxID=2951 RepID=A0A1Q9F4V2_SYMMI|nr:LINE-1 reverse transcriptase-like [Symbiodinium microadriaticum]
MLPQTEAVEWHSLVPGHKSELLDTWHLRSGWDKSTTLLQTSTPWDAQSSRPELDFVNSLTDFVKFDVDALQRQAVAVKCKLFKYQLQVDASDFGGSRSFVRIRPPDKPPFTCVMLDHKAPACLLRRHTFQHCTFQVRDSKPFELLSQVSFAQVQGQVTETQVETVTVLFPADDDIVLPTTGELRRLRHDSSWEGVVGSLMAYWSPIWNRDSAQAASDLEDWPQYCHLVRLLTSPCSQTSVNMLDEAAWHHVARSLSPRKATGVCGWHNKDLRLLPRDALADLASLLDQLLTAGFPDFLMKARVAVLSKVATPDSAAQARPITILSCLFRLWARVLCSQVLQAWSLKLPRSITGCIKGRSALDLSYEIQALVEDSLCQQTDLSGFCLDLRKAFNFLPRAPLEDLLKRLGLPGYVASGWRLSLARVTRSFQIHGSLGPELPSSTGAPEGDPTSVLGMIAVCWFFVALLQGVVSPKAYVDNLSWSSDNPENHAPALLILEDFRQALSLEIDWHKTYQWATSPLSRNWWLTVGVDFLPGDVCLVQTVKELGSYFQFTRRLARGPFLQRVQEALQRLSKLSSDPQGLPTKAQVVQGGVWPFLFFGTEGIAPSCTTMHSLRSAAARAIIGNYHTLSPFAALGFLQGAQDPEIFLLCHHVSQLRRALVTSPSAASQVLRRLAGPPIKQRAVCGPAGALQVLLHRNDWTVHADGSFRGPLHCQFNLFSASARQVRSMFQLAWGSQIQDQTQHRNGLSAAPTPHTALSAAILSSFKPWEQKFLARSMCGGFMSGAERNTWSRDSTDLCPLCQELDTRSHRIFRCPALQDKRLPHQDVLNEVQSSLPHWTYMPYVSWPFEASVLQLFLAKLCLPALAAPTCDQEVLLFTDASALHTTCPTARVTAWAVVRGRPPEHAPDLLPSDLEPASLLPRFLVLGQGCTPGNQTVPRAELAALAWASDWASQQPTCNITVYSDCQPALDLWHKWHRFGWSTIRSCANADLLSNVNRPSCMQVKKIKAHRSSAELRRCSYWDQWLAAGNEAADTAAKQACCELPEALQAMAEEVALHCRSQQRLLKRFFRAILDMGVLDAYKRRQEARQNHESQLSQVAAASTLSELLGRFRTWQVPSTGLLSIPDAWEENWTAWPFGAHYGRCMLHWLQHLRWHEPPATPATTWEVSYLEMMLSFCATAAVPPLVENVFSPGSYWPLVQARSQLQHVSLRQLVTCFRAALLQLGKLLDHVIFPCAEIKDVAYLRFFSIPAPNAGLAARPSLPGCGWIDLLEKLGSSDCAVELLATMLRRPFAAEGRSELAAQVCFRRSPAPDAGEPLRTLVQRMLCRTPCRRPGAQWIVGYARQFLGSAPPAGV